MKLDMATKNRSLNAVAINRSFGFDWFWQMACYLAYIVRTQEPTMGAKVKLLGFLMDEYIRGLGSSPEALLLDDNQWQPIILLLPRTY
jgi:hypothetical protein